MTKEATEIQYEQDVWKRVDAKLCSLFWQSISQEVIPIFHPFQTCFSVWKEAKFLYTNDISQFYSVVDEMLNIRKSEMSIETFFGKIQGLMIEYDTLMPIDGSAEQLAQ